MAIEEVLILRDEVSAAAEAAADATREYASAQREAERATESLSAAQREAASAAAAVGKARGKLAAAANAGRDQASAANELRAALSAQAAAAGKAESATEGLAKAERQAARAAREARAASRNVSRAQGELTRATRLQDAWFQEAKESLGAFGDALETLGPTAVAVGAALVGAFAAGKAIIDLTVETLKAAGAAAVGRDNYERMLDQVTRGRGAEALASIEANAKAMNIPLAEAVENFVALREKGLSNVQSQRVMQLAADLDAAGVFGARAEAAINAVTEAINKGADGEDAIADIAAQFGVVGDGSHAAAKRVQTLEGAIENAKLTGERLFQRVAKDALPAFNAAGAAFTEWLDSAEGSAAVGRAINFVVGAIEALPDIIKTVGAGVDAFLDAAGPGFEALGAAIDIFTESLGIGNDEMGAAEAVGSALGFAVSALASAFAVVGATIGATIAAIQSIKEAFKTIAEAVPAAVEAVKAFVSDFNSAGAALVDGFVQGILDSLPEVLAAATGVGGQAAKALADSLEIGSPSKVAQGYGQNFGTSFADSMQDAMPDSVVAPAAPSNDNAVAAGAAAGGAGNVITITVNASGGANGDDIAAAIESRLRAMGVA